MSKNFNLITSEEVEHTCYPLVKVCSNELRNSTEYFAPILFPVREYYFWTITFPPDYTVINRGRKIPFKSATPKQQYYYIDNLISSACWCEYPFLIFNYEQSLNGSLHLHVITTGCISPQFFKGDILQVLRLDYKKFNDVLNIQYRKIDNPYTAISYFTKLPLDYVSAEYESCIDRFNDSVLKKSYEITHYPAIYLNQLDTDKLFL